MSARKDFAADLRGRLPKSKYDVKDASAMPDVIKKATVVVGHRGYSHPENVRGVLDVQFVVTVASHHTDIDNAEDALDQAVPDVLEAVHASATWQNVERVLVNSKYQGFDIFCSIPHPTPY